MDGHQERNARDKHKTCLSFWASGEDDVSGDPVYGAIAARPVIGHTADSGRVSSAWYLRARFFRPPSKATGGENDIIETRSPGMLNFLPGNRVPKEWQQDGAMGATTYEHTGPKSKASISDTNTTRLLGLEFRGALVNARLLFSPAIVSSRALDCSQVSLDS